VWIISKPADLPGCNNPFGNVWVGQQERNLVLPRTPPTVNSHCGTEQLMQCTVKT
jgi:hypothetical protein